MLMNCEGDCGTGKGIFQTMFAIDTINLYKDHFNKKIKLYTNYKMYHVPNWQYLEPDMLFDIGNDKNYDLYLVNIDEATAWLENRISSHEEMNLYLSYMLFQARKSKEDWIIAEQIRDTIDKRFRLMAKLNIFMHDRRVRVNGELSKDDFVHTDINKYGQMKTFTIKYKEAEKYFHNYDTNEKIYPPSFEHLQYKINSKNSKKLNEMIEKFTNQVLEIIPYEYKNITMNQVKDVCLNAEIPTDYAQHIYARIKNKK